MEIVKVNGLKKEIDDDFVVERIKYLCEKGIVLISNDKEVKRVLDKIIMLTKSFNVNSDNLKKEIENLLIKILGYKQSIEGLYGLEIYIKIKELCEIYHISNENILNLMMKQIETKKKAIKLFKLQKLHMVLLIKLVR